MTSQVSKKVPKKDTYCDSCKKFKHAEKYKIIGISGIDLYINNVPNIWLCKKCKLLFKLRLKLIKV